jgi:hypothetical protein
LAIIGLNDGRPFTGNECFGQQYRWAEQSQAHPDVYINLDFPALTSPQAATGPYGTCTDGDDWCRGYNYGYALAKETIGRSFVLGVSPGRFWLDVEMENHWSDSARNNAQVVRGALDYFLEFNIPVGIYGTHYQWGLITGGYVPAAVVPLWVAGAEDRVEATARCDDQSFEFAGGVTWLVQYPEGGFDGNFVCSTMALATQPPIPSPPVVPTTSVASSNATSKEPSTGRGLSGLVPNLRNLDIRRLVATIAANPLQTLASNSNGDRSAYPPGP